MENTMHLKNQCIRNTDKKSTGKLFTKYELLFLDQANSIFDPSQIWILQFPIPRAFLPPSPFLHNFTLAN